MLANVVYVFCPSYEKGVMFYDQSPSGAVAKLTGSLPEGAFHSSGEKIVEWNDEINGKKKKMFRYLKIYLILLIKYYISK